jgi:organic hydroperoxide reductase OsmC/OhrA
MAEHKATIKWNKSSHEFLRGKFSREHTWSFDGGTTVQASPAPSVVPPPYSNPAFVDPEEAFVASLASCHMLTFLYVASRQGFEVSSYEDEAAGMVTKNERGIPWVSAVTLRPRVVYSGQKQPIPEETDRLHRLAHEHCYIANSIKTQVKVEPAT